MFLQAFSFFREGQDPLWIQGSFFRSWLSLAQGGMWCKARGNLASQRVLSVCVGGISSWLLGKKVKGDRSFELWEEEKKLLCVEQNSAVRKPSKVECIGHEWPGDIRGEVSYCHAMVIKRDCRVRLHFFLNSTLLMVIYVPCITGKAGLNSKFLSACVGGMAMSQDIWSIFTLFSAYRL